MLFEEYLSRLIQFTEDRRLILSRQSEAWSSYNHGASVEFTAKFITALGMPANNQRPDQS